MPGLSLLLSQPKETFYVIVSLIMTRLYKICLPDLLYPRKLPSNIDNQAFRPL